MSGDKCINSRGTQAAPLGNTRHDTRNDVAMNF